MSGVLIYPALTIAAALSLAVIVRTRLMTGIAFAVIPPAALVMIFGLDGVLMAPAVLAQVVALSVMVGALAHILAGRMGKGAR